MMPNRGAKAAGDEAKRPVIVFCCNRLAPTLELAFVMRSLAATGLQPLALLESDRLVSQLPTNTLDGVSVAVLPRLLNRYGPITIPRVFGIIGRSFRLFRLHAFADAFATLRGVVAGDIALRRLFEHHDVQMVVVADDRSLGWEFGVVYSARRRGIPSAAIPFALSDPRADWLARKDRESFDPTRNSWLSRVFKRQMAIRYPENMRTLEGRALMFLSAGQAWVLKALGAKWMCPWAYGGGITDVAAVYGEADRAKQIALGVPASKLVVTGQSSLDSLYSSRNTSAGIRWDLLAEYSLPKDRDVIVCAVPQYLEHGMLEAREHWRLTEQMLASLVRTGANVLLSLHPRSRRDDYLPLAERFGAVIVAHPLIEILPAAHLFVATHSSTVRWAVLLRIPVIVLDDFDVGNGAMYAGGGVQFLKDRSELELLARQLLEDPSLRVSIKADLNRQAQGMDPFDGGNSARVIALLKNQIRSNATPTRTTHSISRRTAP
jgi:hypothetical protein